MSDTRQEAIRKKYWEIWKRTQHDGEYARLFEEMGLLEPKYEAAIGNLPDEIQDLIRDYVDQCEDMSRRMLECACEEILFPEKILPNS